MQDEELYSLYSVKKKLIRFVCRFLAVLVDTWKYRHIDQAIMTVPESTANKRSSVRRSVPPTTSPRRPVVSRQGSLEMDESKEHIPRLRRSSSNPSILLRSLHMDSSKIKQIRQRSISSTLDLNGHNKSFKKLSQQRRVSEPQTDSVPREPVVPNDDSVVLGDVPMQQHVIPRESSVTAAGSSGDQLQHGLPEDMFRGTGYEPTRVFEYDENGNLVEVFEDNVDASGAIGEDSDYDYDEEYIEVVYEGNEGESDSDENEVHIVLEEPDVEEDVASHITWL